MAMIFLSSTTLVRRHFYEMFSKLHLILAPLAVIGISLHIPSQEYLKPPQVYILATLILYGVVLGSELVYAVWRNFRRHALLNVVDITSSNLSTDAVMLKLALARPWKFRAGQ